MGLLGRGGCVVGCNIESGGSPSARITLSVVINSLTTVETSEIQTNQYTKINGVEIIPDKNRYSSGATNAKMAIATITKTTKCRLPTS